MPALSKVLHHFNPISLDALKDKAELMDRRDNKYVLTAEQVIGFLRYTHFKFDILEIDGLRQFNYFSQYFDSKDLYTYADHNKGRRRRIKVRQRHYVDSGRYYFEVKLKGFRNLTQKFRIPYKPADLRVNGLNDELLDFCQTTITGHYGEEWHHVLLPSISVGYERITLVAKTGDERITLDNGIYYQDELQTVTMPLNDEKWVVEVKSLTGRTAVDRWLFGHGSRPVSLCSKYAMGINLLRQPEVNNRFSVVLRRNFGYSPNLHLA